MTKNKLILIILAICILSTLLLAFFFAPGECEHNWSEYFVDVAPTLEKAGVSKSICPDCGEERTKEIPQLTHIEHSYSKVWGQDETHHWLECEFEGCDATTVKSEHKWQDTPTGRKCPICQRTAD